MTQPFAEGDRCLLLDTKQRRYLITLAAGAEFHTHHGLIPHEQIIGSVEGQAHRSTRNAVYIALRPTLEDFVVEMPRGAQVIYPKDLAPICMLADIGPGVRVFETGLGSGALSMTMLRWGAEITGYEIRDDFANRATANVRSFLGADALSRYHVELRDAYAGIDGTFDRMVLDLPEPWQLVPFATTGALRPGASCWPIHRRSSRPARCVRRSRQRRSRGTPPAPWRCCTARGTSRAPPCGPTTGWSPTRPS